MSPAIGQVGCARRSTMNRVRRERESVSEKQRTALLVMGRPPVPSEISPSHQQARAGKVLAVPHRVQHESIHIHPGQMLQDAAVLRRAPGEVGRPFDHNNYDVDRAGLPHRSVSPRGMSQPQIRTTHLDTRIARPRRVSQPSFARQGSRHVGGTRRDAQLAELATILTSDIQDSARSMRLRPIGMGWQQFQCKSHSSSIRLGMGNPEQGPCHARVRRI